MTDAKTSAPPVWVIDQCSLELGHGRRIRVWSEPRGYAWRVWAVDVRLDAQRTGKSASLGRAKNDAMSAAKSLGWL